MSGIDEQDDVELKCRMFFRMGDLLETLNRGDFVKGDIFFLDENLDGQAFSTEIENLKKFARIEKIMITYSFPVLQNLIKLIGRVGLKHFNEEWF